MQKLPVGISDFKTVIAGNYYYVDKSLLLKELMDQGAQALLIPRPRRFGKTLNLSMMRYFFEKTEVDNSRLFRHLKIWQAGEEYVRQQGQYPVIFLTFKDVKERDWESARGKIFRLLQEEFLRHKYLRESAVLDAEERDYCNRIIQLTAEQSAHEDGLKYLSQYLNRHYQQKVVLLIDEYDTPIQAGYVNGYYAEVVSFMRNFLSAGLKDNSYLEKGVLTGIMRVAKESIFSGLNNLSVFTLLNQNFSDKFGLTEDEVKRMLDEFALEEHYKKVSAWYNGYQFAGKTIYNPWSIINFTNRSQEGFKPYWVNTSDNAIVEQLLTRGGAELKSEMQSLLDGATIEKPVEENIIFRDLEKKDDLLWSFLLFGGYLKYVGQRMHNKKTLLRLQIPNLEVSYFYDRLVEGWFEARMANEKLEALLHALLSGDVETFETLLSELVLNSFSVHDFGDESEKVYQAFVIGLLVWLAGRYEVKSNRESGYGRYDVMLIPQDLREAGLILEFKKVNTKRRETKARAFAAAFKQIAEKKYAAELQSRGVTKIRQLAVVFKGKQVWVKEKSARAPKKRRAARGK